MSFRILVFVSFVFFIAFSCTDLSDGRPTFAEAKTLAEVKESIAPAAQEFLINPRRDTLLTLEKGTVLFFPAKCFRLPGGAQADSTVTLTVEEYYSVKDFVSRNLSTISNDRLLESAGMLNISAVSGSSPLEVSDTMSYVVSFPKRSESDSISLFYGDAHGGDVNWTPAGLTYNYVGDINIQRSSYYDLSLLDSTNYKCKLKIVGHGLRNENDNVDAFADSLREVFDEKYSPFYTVEEEYCKESWFVNFDVYVSKTGKIIDVNISGAEGQITNDIQNFLLNLPAFDMSKVKRSKIDAPILITVQSITEIDEVKYRAAFERKFSKYREKAIDRMGKTDAEYFLFNSTKLNWINCDRFVNSQGEKTDFTVKANVSDKVSAHLIFIEINSVLKGRYLNGQIIFPDVPVNSKVKLVVIDFPEDKPLLVAEKTVVTNKLHVAGKPKPCSLGELETALSVQ